jgi:ubiquinone/menaquinone biosynthesis C-methylase UbiE
MKFNFNKKNIYIATLTGGLFLLTLGLSSIAVSRNKEEIAFTPSPQIIKIDSQHSIVHLGSLDSFDKTEGGIQAGKFVLEALEKKDKEAAKKAIDLYNLLIPKENYGGEYTALQWFAQYIVATDAQKQEFFQDKLARDYFEFWGADDFANLKEYIKRKYKLATFEDTQANKQRETFLEDFILFNNPRREEWEKTSKIMEAINIKPGTRIADIGSGPGYYTFRFAEAVGEKGKVYAIDTVQTHLDYLKKIANKYGINNIETVKIDKTDTIGLPPDQVDVAFMCSLYHIIYMTDIEFVKDRYIASIKSALKPGGKFIVVDNALVESDELPYHGPYIAKELIIAQLEHYGFRLTEQYQFVPQRYVLVFQMVDE